MKGFATVEERIYVTDDKVDILSHPKRRDKIHILTLDPILAADVHERIHEDKRLKRCKVIRPHAVYIPSALEEIAQMAQDTVSSRLLIFDVRRVTLPKLRWAYNAIVGYNRKNFNKLCYTILIGDGPVSLFRAGRALEVFIPHLSSHRVDYHPAVFFYDPLLHYEANELDVRGVDEEFQIPDSIPRRLVPYFQKGPDVKVDNIRRFFRATDKPEDVKRERRRTLKRLYKKRIAEQFPHHEDQLKAWLSRKGIQLATEKLHLYPLYFEDWVYSLIRKARHNATASSPGST